jgi:hypothetical protein
MIEEMKIYAQNSRVLVQKGDMFSLDLITLRFMMDMIGKTILLDLSTSLNDLILIRLGKTEPGAQKGYNKLADCMISQIR